MPKSPRFKVGDQVECIHSPQWGAGHIIRINTVAGVPYYRVFFEHTKSVQVLSAADLRAAGHSLELLTEEKQDLEKLLRSYERNLNLKAKAPHLTSQMQKQMEMEMMEVRRILERLLEIHNLILSRLEKVAANYDEVRIPSDLSIQIAGEKADFARLEERLQTVLESKPYRRQMRVGLGWLTAAIIAGAVIIVALGYYQEYRARQRSLIPSDKFGVILAEFGGGPRFEKVSVGENVIDLLYDNLTTRLKETDLDGVILRRTELIDGAEKARRTGKEMGAHIVVWGWVPAGGKEALVPTFSLIKRTAQPTGFETIRLSAQPTTRAKALITFIVGLIYLLEDAHHKAVETFTEAIDLAGGEAAGDKGDSGLDNYLAVVHLFRGRACAAQNNLEAARADYEKAIDLDSEYARPHIDLGNLYFLQGKFQESLEEYREVIENRTARDEDRALAYYSMGLAYVALGEDEQAARSFQKAAELAASDETLRAMAQKGLRSLPTPTATFTPSPTAVPATETFTPPPTFTLPPPIATPTPLRPTPAPSPTPTPSSPSPSPTLAPTALPTETVTAAPTETETTLPTETATVPPTLPPTVEPGPTPTEAPTELPTLEPGPTPTEAPTEPPTVEPGPTPTEAPTEPPTIEPGPTTPPPTQAPQTRETLPPPSPPPPIPTPAPSTPTSSPAREPQPVETPEPLPTS